MSDKPTFREATEAALAALSKLDSSELLPNRFQRLVTYVYLLSTVCQPDTGSLSGSFALGKLYEYMELYSSAENWLTSILPQSSTLCARSDFLSTYPVHSFSASMRAECFWRSISDAWPTLRKKRLSPDIWAHLFQTLRVGQQQGDPNRTALSIATQRESQPMSLILPAFVVGRAPAALLKKGSITVGDPQADVDAVSLEGQEIDLKDVLVRGTKTPSGRLKLELYHPIFRDKKAVPNDVFKEALADSLLETAIGALAKAAWLEEVSVSREPLGGTRIIPLCRLRRALEVNGFQTDLTLDSALAALRKSYTCTPSQASAPRSDIVRGETIFPALTCCREEPKLYGTIANLDSSGIGNWFLTIPNAVCGEHPQELREKLEQSVRDSVKDSVRFLGWAEGTRNFYIDFLEFDPRPVLGAMERFFQTIPGGDKVRICSFRPNAPLRTLSVDSELAKLAAQVGKYPERMDARAAKHLLSGGSLRTILYSSPAQSTGGYSKGKSGKNGKKKKKR